MTNMDEGIEPEDGLGIEIELPIVNNPPQRDIEQVGQAVDAITKISYSFLFFTVVVIVSFTCLGVTSFMILDAWIRGLDINSWACGAFMFVVGYWTPKVSASKTKKRTIRMPRIIEV